MPQSKERLHDGLVYITIVSASYSTHQANEDIVRAHGIASVTVTIAVGFASFFFFFRGAVLIARFNC
jgi:hypothetical protein